MEVKKMFENLADKKIVQQGHPDITTIKQYHPEILSKLRLLFVQMGFGMGVLTGDFPSGMITSGYRDNTFTSGAKNSSHKFGLAIDIAVGGLGEQIRWLKNGVTPSLFNRGGLYPDMGIVHLDDASNEWMNQYYGTKYWVCIDGIYKGFNVFENAIKYAYQKSEE
jgi:hypothetical protein